MARKKSRKSFRLESQLVKLAHKGSKSASNTLHQRQKVDAASTRRRPRRAEHEVVVTASNFRDFIPVHTKKVCGLELLDDWVRAATRPTTKLQRQGISRRLREALGEISDLRQIDVNWVEGLQRYWLHEGRLKPQTVMVRLDLLSSFLTFAVRVGAIETNPIQLRSKNSRLKSMVTKRAELETLSLEEVRQLLSCRAIPMHDWFLWTTLLLTGARKMEAAGLSYGDIKPKRPLNQVHIARQWMTEVIPHSFQPTKTSEERVVPAHPYFMRMVRASKEWTTRELGRPARDDDPLCPFPKSGGIQRWTGKTILLHWAESLKLAGIPNPTANPRKVHATRHTFISMLTANRVNTDVIGIMTHTKARVGAIAGYIHGMWPELCDAVRTIKIDEEG